MVGEEVVDRDYVVDFLSFSLLRNAAGGFRWIRPLAVGHRIGGREKEWWWWTLGLERVSEGKRLGERRGRELRSM